MPSREARPGTTMQTGLAAPLSCRTHFQSSQSVEQTSASRDFEAMAFSSQTYARRRELVRKLLRSKKLDALLVTAEKNVAWLTGFTGDSTWLIVTQNGEQLLSDSRFTTQIEEECPGVASFIRESTERLSDVAVAQLKGHGVERCGFEGHALTWETANSLQSHASEGFWTAVNWEIEQLRAIKDKDEIAEIRSAIRLAERGFEYFKAILTPQQTERQLAALLEQAMREFGAVGCSFPAIIAVGDRAALPHYRPGDITVTQSSTLLIDWGARTRSGYVSDLTRTLLTGKKDKTYERVYKTVLEAQQRAIEAIAPGVLCRDVDAVARQIIQKAGYGKNFGHGLGHGIGLDVHELPRLAGSSGTVLKPGMVVTVEPGIYLPGWGGVRIEDDVLVTRDGFEVLSSTPKGWNDIAVAC